MKHFNLQMKRAKDSRCSLRKKTEVRKGELKQNEDAILKFLNISSDAMSPNEMHEVSSASTSKSIPEVQEETMPGPNQK